MDRFTDGWESMVLGKRMDLVVYGHYGPALLLFPPGDDHLEYERSGLIESIDPFLAAGRIKVITVSSVNSESWFNQDVPPRQRSIRHQQYNRYISEEVVPFIARNMRSSHPTIFTGGVAFGALHAVNTFLRRPDLFQGTIGLSGIYDLKAYTNGYYDDDVYFNSPMDYLPNLTGPVLNSLRQKEKVYLLSGKGAGEDPNASWALGELMGRKEIKNWVDLWGEEYGHDWNTWKAMLATVLGKYF